MSAGAVFKLIANDGKADRMIMATELTYNYVLIHTYVDRLGKVY